MRPVLTGVCLSLLTLSLGCTPFKTGPAVIDDGKTWGAAAPKPADLVAYLNQNGQALRSVEAKSVFISAKQDNETIGGLEGFLACQKAAKPGTPPNFRLQALALGSPEVDIGSNSEEFWFWIKRSGPQPMVYHCAYADYPKVAASGRMPFPIQPEWVVEALGMAEYDRNGKYEMNESKATYDLVQRTRSAKGDEVVKVIAFHKPHHAGGSQVAAYILYETTNDAKHPYRELCSAVIEESKVVPVGSGKNAVLPTKVRLTCPKEKMVLTMELDKVQANVAFDQERITTLFTRQTLNNYKSYDLARGPDAPASSVRPAGGWNR
ncbi:MAG TPA: hypothetical protein VKA46_23155 [Gemmataceae bacterium]|nr:hypothetical protein [Gemmataceae bacterium]